MEVGGSVLGGEGEEGEGVREEGGKGVEEFEEVEKGEEDGFFGGGGEFFGEAGGEFEEGGART